MEKVIVVLVYAVPHYIRHRDYYAMLRVITFIGTYKVPITRTSRVIKINLTSDFFKLYKIELPTV